MIRRALLLAVLILAVAAGTAWAHGLEPFRSSPEAGSQLEASPAEVRLWFEEEIAAQGSWVRVLDEQQKQVDQGDGGVDVNGPQGAQLSVRLPVLPQGAYQVVWQVALLDGDTSSGSYWFGVGGAALPPSEAQVAKPEAPNPRETISPWVWAVLAAGLLLIGIALGIWLGARRKLE